MTDQLWGSIALSAEIARPCKVPEHSAVAFSITREGIDVLRRHLGYLERDMDAAFARAQTSGKEPA